MLLAVLLLVAVSAFAQPGAPLVTAAHIHLNSADPDAAMHFWNETIGTSTTSIGSLSGVGTLGVKILFTKKGPSGPSAGSAIDHLGFRVPDLSAVEDRLGKTSYKAARPQGTTDRMIVDGPDGVRVELLEENSAYTPLEFNHVHVSAKQPKEMQAWYVKNLGARAGPVDNVDGILLAGANLAISPAAAAAPAAGRAIDHLSFEVKDLEGFCKKLVEGGAKLESAPHAEAEQGGSVAMVSDPWGVRLELIEKAAR